MEPLVQTGRADHIPVIGRGRGTNTTGATMPVEGGLVVSFKRMKRIVRIDPDNRLAVVEPGLLNGDLQQALKPHGFFWPPDPTSSPWRGRGIGGNLACNSAGPRTVKYGSPREHTLGLRAVAGTGEGFRCGTYTSKGATGYDLTRLLIGSEGTLALITEATLKLTPKPSGLRTMRAACAGRRASAGELPPDRGHAQLLAKFPACVQGPNASGHGYIKGGVAAVQVRKATIDDAPAVFAIRREAILASCRGHYPPGDLAVWTSGELSAAFAARVADHCHVALLDGRVVGSGMIDVLTSRIDAMFVHPACMRRGVGRAMMDHLETLARCAGLPAIHLASTLNAAPFDRALGFQGEGRSAYRSSLGVSLACVPLFKHLQGSRHPHSPLITR